MHTSPRSCMLRQCPSTSHQQHLGFLNIPHSVIPKQKDNDLPGPSIQQNGEPRAFFRNIVNYKTCSHKLFEKITQKIPILPTEI